MKTTRVGAIIVLVLAVGTVGIMTVIMNGSQIANAGGCLIQHSPPPGKNGAEVCHPTGQSQTGKGGFVCNHGSGCREIAPKVGCNRLPTC